MKYNYTAIILCVGLFMMTGCDDSTSIQDMTQPEGQALYTYPLEFDTDYPSYESGAESTRATDAGSWENGDMVYFRFDNNGANVWGSGEYNKSKDEWTLTCYGALTSLTNAKCVAWYGKGAGQQTQGSDYIAYDYLTAAFSTENGHYDCNNSTVKITATLKPNRRLRFKGSAGTKISVKGDSQLNSLYAIHQTSGSGFYRRMGDTNLTVKNDGYTDYMAYYIDHNNTKIFVEDQATGTSYYRSFNDQILGQGESGYFTLPSQSNLHGWTKEQTVAHEYVDLGLPSGTLWATCNVGASSPDEDGTYFAWGEITGYDSDTADGHSFYWPSYKYCNGNAYTLTKYCTNSEYGNVDYKSELEVADDAAYITLGDEWRMPNLMEFTELKWYCDWVWTTVNGKKGYRITSKNNGNSIFLPATGYRDQSNLYYYDTYGDYWTKTLYEDSPRSAYYLEFGQDFISCDTYWYRCYGRTIRPVRGEHTVTHEYVDLGLPSGCLWSTCNIGASNSTQIGSYFAWGELDDKEKYSWDTYSGYQVNYDVCPDYGSDISGTSHDAAHMLWGGSWRMPSISEAEELRIYCTWTQTTMNGIEGFEVRSTQNNNSIFLPLTGYRGKDGGIFERQERGHYWTSTLDQSDPKQAFYLGFKSNSSNVYTDNNDRFVGRIIRPIQGGHLVSYD